MTRRRADSIESELSRLVELGFSRQTVDRLINAGVNSLRQILLFNAEELQELLGSPDTDLPRRLINTARELLAEAPPSAVTARERIEAISKMPVLGLASRAWTKPLVVYASARVMNSPVSLVLGRR
ncbi:hypothetical protein [Vulcanisaeta distributa]|uniref:hypothetical protein n=1 Tax=Vulcanisaeta distributa TaxID=164451 RepID=UPI000B20FEBE|nr:hypothetical protein [Vulcanisaeta distributa]